MSGGYKVVKWKVKLCYPSLKKVRLLKENSVHGSSKKHCCVTLNSYLLRVLSLSSCEIVVPKKGYLRIRIGIRPSMVLNNVGLKGFYLLDGFLRGKVVGPSDRMITKLHEGSKVNLYMYLSVY